MAEEQKTNGEEIPPKLDLTKNGESPEMGVGKGDTMQIQVPPGSEAPTLKIRPGAKPEGPATEKAKKETSRIPLEEATTEPSDGKGKPANTPKTIRIKPITKKKAVVPVASKTEPASLDDKRKTSRISLDAVFSETDKDDGEAPSDRPKTIRLKRPTEAATIKIARRPTPPAAPTAEAAPPSSEAKTVLSKTARIDDLPEAEEEITPTRRKTIRVKRPTSSQPVKSLSIKRTEEEGAEGLDFVPEEPPPPPDEPNFLFPLFAVAALLIICVTIYVLCSQTFGPNASLTQLSWWPSGPSLGWPDKIPLIPR